MPALPRSYFAEPDPFAGWSEERKRFFMEYGYDPQSAQKKDTTKATRTTTTTTDDDGFSKTVVKDTEDLTEARMGEGNILQRPRGSSVTLPPPDDVSGLLQGGSIYPEDLPEYGPAGVEETFVSVPDRPAPQEDEGMDWKNFFFASPGESKYWPPTEEDSGGLLGGYADTIIEGQEDVAVDSDDSTVAGKAGTNPEAVGDAYEGLLVGQEDDSGIPLSAQTGAIGEAFLTREDVEETADDTNQKAEIDRIWGFYGEDIGAKRDRYLSALKEIYKKVAILNVIGALTNSPSQAGAFMALAEKKFQALEGFAGEERLQNIAKGVFFTEDGQFDPPKSKEEAFNRAKQFGATQKEAEDVSGHIAAPSTKTSKYVTWSRRNANTGEWEETKALEGEIPTKALEDDGGGEWTPGQASFGTPAGWQKTKQVIESTLRTRGRDAAIQELIFAWSQNPMYALMFGDQLDQRADDFISAIERGMNPDIDTNTGNIIAAEGPRGMGGEGASKAQEQSRYN